MRRAAMLVAAAAVLLGTTSLNAQAPNFSGKWTMVVDPNAAAAGGRGGRGGGGFGNEFTIAQDATTLTTIRTTQAGDVKAVYKLDGSESKNQQAGRQGGAPTDVISHAKWDGQKIVISTTRDMQGTAVTTTQTFSLDTSGNLLITSVRPGQGGGDPVTTVVTYKKG